MYMRDKKRSVQNECLLTFNQRKYMNIKKRYCTPHTLTRTDDKRKC